MAQTGMSVLEGPKPYLSLAETVSCGSLSNGPSQGSSSSGGGTSGSTGLSKAVARAGTRTLRRLMLFVVSTDAPLGSDTLFTN